MKVIYKYCVSYLKPDRHFTSELYFNDKARAERFAERKRRTCTNVEIIEGNFEVEEDMI